MSSLNFNKKTDINIKLENEKTNIKLENEDILPTTKKLKIEKSDDTVIIENYNLEEGIQYRLRMKNVPKFASVKMIKDLLAKNGCGSLNVKKSPKWNYCFVQLKSREQQLEVIEKLKDVTLKNKAIVVTVDNITEKERQLLFDNKREANKERFLNEQGEQRSPEELLADQTTPLHRLPYSEQLKFKDDGIKKSLSTFRNNIKELTKDRYRPKWVAEEVESNLPCEVRTIISSPILEGYRNKCEFTIGKNLNGEKTVGFLLGAYKDGLNTVLEPEKSLNVSEVAKKIATAMQGLTEDQINKEKLSLAEYFESLAKEEQINLKSLLVQVYDGVSDCISDKYPYEVISGDSFIHEEMMGCRFRISPRAFFQTNTLAAQVLYEKCSEYIKDLCNPDKPPPVLIDMCCGTGTIGICLSKALGNKIEKVIGIEICEEAVEDAKINATLNEIKNAEYILGPVEKNLRALNNYNNSTAGTVIAIVDPPRAGIHKNVIKALRNCQAIDYFLYISCDYNLATRNFIDLCRPSTNAFTGIPFKPVRAVGVDLFPHAKQVELLIEFHRDDYYSSTNES
ncbi:10421_t:CDS:10 [Diversispora eburnea]|uniref:10421_t:CDS:1 n=1 Tax=Diversispora eburnea TaxID=1213867 RepID=A0A9N8UZ42_9GLOM|nr:10421_t:CDS:10 [Diversispora eburnea]